jgi:hypothetical protein
MSIERIPNMRSAVRVAVLTALAAAPVLQAVAATPAKPLDPSEFLVSTVKQVDHRWVRIARDAAGNFVVVWQSYEQGGTATGYDVYAQRYDAAGQPEGGEFRVNSDTTGNQFNPAVAMDAAGDFVVVWGAADQTGDATNTDVYARQYKADGSPVQSSEFLVNTYTTGVQDLPVVAMDAGGDFVVAWESYNEASATSDYDIYARRYDAAGTALTGEFQVNTFTSAFQSEPAVAMDAAGDFVVVWQSYDQASANSQFDIYARPYRSDGSPVQLSEFPVNTYTSGGQTAPVIAMDAMGDFVVAWESYEQVSSTSKYDIYARQYRAGGTAVQSSEFLVDSFTREAQYAPSVAMDAAGDFVVAWQSYGQVSSSGAYDIYARQYNSAGTALQDSGFLVDTLTSNTQAHPAVAMDAAGDFLVGWQSFNHVHGISYYQVYARRYAGEEKVALAAGLAASPASVAAGSSVSLSLDVEDLSGAKTGFGNADIDAALAGASGIVATFTLPAGVALSASGTHWTCDTPSGGELQCHYDILLPAATAASTLTATFTAPGSAGNLPFKVAVSDQSSTVYAGASVSVKAAGTSGAGSSGGGGTLDILSILCLGLPLLRRRRDRR